MLENSGFPIGSTFDEPVMPDFDLFAFNEWLEV